MHTGNKFSQLIDINFLRLLSYYVRETAFQTLLSEMHPEQSQEIKTRCNFFKCRSLKMIQNISLCLGDNDEDVKGKSAVSRTDKAIVLLAA